MIWPQCLIDCESPTVVNLFVRQFGACLAFDETGREFLTVEGHYVFRCRRGFLDDLVAMLERKGFAARAGGYPDCVTIGDPEDEIQKSIDEGRDHAGSETEN